MNEKNRKKMENEVGSYIILLLFFVISFFLIRDEVSLYFFIANLLFFVLLKTIFNKLYSYYKGIKLSNENSDRKYCLRGFFKTLIPFAFILLFVMAYNFGFILMCGIISFLLVWLDLALFVVFDVWVTILWIYSYNRIRRSENLSFDKFTEKVKNGLFYK